MLELKFSAQLVGQAKLPQPKTKQPVAVDVYELHANEADIAFLKKATAHYKQPENVPKLPIADKAGFYDEHVWESFAESEAALKAKREGSVTRAPLVHVAIDPKNKALLGINLSGKERTLDNGDKMYTPLPLDVEGDRIADPAMSPNHWSANFLTKTTPLRSVGDTLMVAMQNALPSSVKRVDVVSVNGNNAVSPKAEGFYSKYGFTVQQQIRDQQIIGAKPNPNMPTFREAFNGADPLPMSASRGTLAATSKLIAKQLAYESKVDQPEVDLNKTVQLQAPGNPIVNAFKRLIMWLLALGKA